MSNQKQLWILRHAQAEKGSDDLARPLSALGCEQAQRAAAALRHSGPVYDTILCSTAVRTWQTAMYVGREGPVLPGGIVVSESAYEASAGRLFELLKERDNILLVGHNPGVSELVGFLCGQGSMALGCAAFVGLTWEGELGASAAQVIAQWEPPSAG